ncbi:MAG TPA: hypothetical protein VE288_10660 [Rubrobacteraceae bacterium]|jgi:hypothetical protein|nr:hypothetical protein [Rubrobacteraceae bacterium]
MMRHNGDITGDNTLRAPVVKAAELLGLTEGAVRQRIKRGTLPIEKAADGSVYVLLDADLMRTNSDSTRTNTDGTDDLSMTIERLDSEVNFLRSELITRNEELRRKDHIIAALTERIPELEAPSEERESHETPAPEGRGNTTNAAPDTERRSWWRRLWGV